MWKWSKCWNQYTPCLLLSCIIMTKWILTQLVTTVRECTHYWLCSVCHKLVWGYYVLILNWCWYKLIVIYISISYFTCLITVGCSMTQPFHKTIFFMIFRCWNLVTFFSILLFHAYNYSEAMQKALNAYTFSFQESLFNEKFHLILYEEW